MNETAPTDQTPPATETNFPGLRPALILGAGLLCGLGLSLALVLRDNAHRTELEVITESTAVGDTHYYKLPDPLPEEPFPAVAHFQGQPLIPTGYKQHDKREADMQPLAKDEATGLTIYQAPVKPKDREAVAKEKEAGEPPTYFIKVAPGGFLKVRPAANPATRE